MEGLATRDYNRIARRLRSQYKKRYQITEHCYPDLQGWRYKLKWQFPRGKMDYDFKPRHANKQIAKKFIKHHNIFVDNVYTKYYERPEVVN